MLGLVQDRDIEVLYCVISDQSIDTFPEVLEDFRNQENGTSGFVSELIASNPSGTCCFVSDSDHCVTFLHYLVALLLLLNPGRNRFPSF
jgi:hypothetical protein